MLDHKEYLTEDFGILPERGVSSFNNIVYLTGLVVGAKFQKAVMFIPTTEQYDILFEKHCDATEDEHGLYAPKNSHDNITMKLVGSMALGTTHWHFMDLYEACKGANFHPRDVILYCFLLGNPILSLCMRPFLFIPAISIIFAALSEGKIRPRGFLWDMIKNRPKIVDRIKTKDGWIKTYLYKDDTKKSYRLHQNDGKILSFYRLLVTVKRSATMRLTGQIFESIMHKRYGYSYMQELYYNYFPDGYEHPTTAAWYGIHAPLEIVEKL